MNPTQDGPRERLLKLEQITPSLKRRYEREIADMLEQKMTGIRRWIWLVAALAGLGFAVGFSIMAVVLPAEFPWQGRVGFAGSALFGVGWAILGFRVFRKGSLNLKTDMGASAAMSWIFPVFLVTIFMMAAPNNIAGVRMILFGMVFLVMGAVFLIVNMIVQSHLKSSEKLLEIEYRLAELAEAIKPGRSLPSTPQT